MSSAPQVVIESPAPGQNVYDEAVFISGWIYCRDRDPRPSCVRAYLDDHCCGETRNLFARPEIAERERFPDGVVVGFRVFGRMVPPLGETRRAALRIAALFNGTAEMLATQNVELIPAGLRERPYGSVVSPANDRLLHRENIYGSGPPIEEAGVEVSNLLHAYLPVGASVVDVGCGAGAYGPPLMASGHDWLGLEANAHCLEILKRRELPFRTVDLLRGDLPCTDGEYDSAVCIEVLEHTKEPEKFVSEIARIIRGRALFSVPNLELLPYLHDWRVVPWHLLEGDHKNFFTRGNLSGLLNRFFREVEIFPYGEHPLRTRDGVPLYVHLLAIADK
ncbi:MAG TPA: class I SAM-dependent methyltransferase [Chthoniobacterales bacterium]